jgi:hypothetical protein
MCGEILMAVHAEISLLRTVPVAVETILDEQRLDFVFKCLIGHGRCAKDEEREKTRKNHDLGIRSVQLRAFQLICKLGDWVKGFSRTENFLTTNFTNVY